MGKQNFAGLQALLRASIKHNAANIKFIGQQAAQQANQSNQTAKEIGKEVAKAIATASQKPSLIGHILTSGLLGVGIWGVLSQNDRMDLEKELRETKEALQEAKAQLEETKKQKTQESRRANFEQDRGNIFAHVLQRQSFLWHNPYREALAKVEALRAKYNRLSEEYTTSTKTSKPTTG